MIDIFETKLSLADQLRTMLIQEQRISYRSREDYFIHHIYQRGIHIPSAKDRKVLCEWSYNIINACHLDKSAACVAISLADRFMSSNSPQAEVARISRRTFQLIFVTALVLSLKMRCSLGVDSGFVSDILCHGLYSESEVNTMEIEMLMTLEWRLNGPCAHDFIEYFVEFFLDDSCSVQGKDLKMPIVKVAKNKADEAMTEYSNALRIPSSIALESIVEAFHEVHHEMVYPFKGLELNHDVKDVVAATDLCNHRR